LFYRRPAAVPTSGRRNNGDVPAAEEENALLKRLLLALLAPLRSIVIDDPRRLSGLNWKGVIAEHVKAVYSYALFPDHRAEWLPWARRVLRDLLPRLRPDVVVTSHEPACSLPLGQMAARAGFAWVADLGDPVLAGYTPPRWQRRARRLEREVCRDATLVSVTTRATAELLAARHGLPARHCVLLPQGFDATFDPAQVPAPDFDTDILELLYTGSLYSFRTLEPLIKAVVEIPGVRLNVATLLAPAYLKEAGRVHSRSVRILGFLPHESALAAQCRCDVLVNVANADSVQIPGKVHEYLQARRPILHLRGPERDAVSELIESVCVGWDVEADPHALRVRLADLIRRKREGVGLLECPQWAKTYQYSWQALARRWTEEVDHALSAATREELADPERSRGQ
jgi:glycosyltransferase involved in cell wall biosynthesis